MTKAKMTPRERLMAALKGEVPDRVPCNPYITRYARYHYSCACPRHQVKVAQDFGLDVIATFGQYIWQSVSNDYIYAPGGGYNFNALGVYGDLPEVKVEIRVENKPEHVWYYRKFYTPAGQLRDVTQWARPNGPYGDGPNPHRVEPLVKNIKDLDALQYLYPQPRKDMIADIPLMLEDIGDRAVLAAQDATSVGSWGMEVLGPEQQLICSLTDPELLKGVCRLANNTHLRNLRAMLEQGFEVVFDSWFQCGPSVGWSMKTYKEIFLPLIKESVDLTHEFGAIYIHQDDGKQKDIIPFLVDIGVDVLAGLQPPDVGDVILKDVKKQYGDKVALLGGLDSCYTFDMGNAELVTQAAKKAIEDAAPGGGYILGTGEAVAPEIPPQCLHALVQASRDFGIYGVHIK